MEQLGIFDPPPRARRRDPETSHTAAARASGFAQSHRDLIMRALADPGTIKDLAARTGLDHVAVARRMSELQERNLAKPTAERRDGCRVWTRT